MVPAPSSRTAAPISVVAAEPAQEPVARELAARLGHPRASVEAWRAGAVGPVVVWCEAAGLALRGTAASRAKPVRPLPPVAARPGRDPLLRAVGPWRCVLDATAGWGADAGTLAAAGRDVTLVERHAVLAALLGDALERWRRDGIEAASRMRLVVGDARTHLATAVADVVFLDPMYPEAAGGGGARKAEGLHLLRLLAGADGDQEELLALARRAARQRVVVKRPRHAPPLAGRSPNGALVGRTVRYDLYAPEEVDP